MSLATDAKTAEQRATIAADMIKRGDTHCRAFDDCFEMGDGDDVMDSLIEKIPDDQELALSIKSTMLDLGYGDFNVRMRQAVDEALSI